MTKLEFIMDRGGHFAVVGNFRFRIYPDGELWVARVVPHVGCSNYIGIYTMESAITFYKFKDVNPC